MVDVIININHHLIYAMADLRIQVIILDNLR